MAIHTFGAIDVGSYELGLKIYEISKGKGIRTVDHLERRIDLGTDTYATGKIRPEHVREVAAVLSEFRKVMDVYRVEDYKAYGTSAIREMNNASIVLSQWEQETGIHVDVLSNSGQRFLDYKSVASKGEQFTRMISDTCAIVDIGGGSIQISTFNEDRLYATQNLRLGILRIYDQLSHFDVRPKQRTALIEELVNSQLEIFRKFYVAHKKIHNIIIVDDYMNGAMQAIRQEILTAERFEEFYQYAYNTPRQELARKLSMTEDAIELLEVTMAMIRCIVRSLGAETIWAPGVTLCDGIAYEYAEARKIVPPSHDFDADIIACAHNISSRYQGSTQRSQTLEHIALSIFDATKRIHGLGAREALLLRIAAILHDCGKYISIVNLPECCYNIIMSTEIIGLSHIEREIVANVVRYNHDDFVYYEEQEEASDLDRQSYLVISRLTAILRLANGLDRSHKHKFEEIRLAIRDDKLIITVPSGIDITLEKGMFSHRADFFEEVFGIRPVIKQKAN